MPGKGARRAGPGFCVDTEPMSRASVSASHSIAARRLAERQRGRVCDQCVCGRTERGVVVTLPLLAIESVPGRSRKTGQTLTTWRL
jgi:hypothetical protein